jgi:hypothetical protein
MTPIFKNCAISKEDMGDVMRKHYADNNLKVIPGKKLIGSMFGTKILLYTPLLKWYLEHGLIMTKVYQVVEYTRKKCFSQFVDDVSNARRDGDVKPELEIIAETMKLLGNSSYGYTVMNKEKHVKVAFCADDKVAKHINDPFFKDLNELNGQNEIIKTKRVVQLNIPLQIGCAVYQLAKLRMLAFYYDFIDKYIDRKDFQYCETDTDSAYIAFSNENVDSLIRPELLAEYKNDIVNWFPRTDTAENIAFDKRTPGLFKIEIKCDGIISLCSKMYICWSNDGKTKCSAKGIQKHNNELTKQLFFDVLFHDKKHTVTNTGFRARDNTMFSYTQPKKGLSYQYSKRLILADGVSTIPLSI